jgi:hypothetical protein
VSFAAFLSNLSVPFQWWVVVAPWERAVRARGGKHASVLGPGLHLKIPFLDRVSLVSVRTRMLSSTGQTMRLRDGRSVTVNIAVQFSIADVLRLFETISNPETTILLSAQAAVARAMLSQDGESVTAQRVEEIAGAAMPGAEWGLGDVRVWVTSFVQAKTYRLMMHEYTQTSGLDQVLSSDDDRRIRA